MKEQDSVDSGARRARTTALRAAGPPASATPPDGPDPGDGSGAQPEQGMQSVPETVIPQIRDRRNQSNLVPTVAALFALLIGLSDILSVIDSAWKRQLVHSRLHRIAIVMPARMSPSPAPPR